MNAPSPPTALPFDRVVITSGDKRKELSADEFLAIPLNQRVRHLLQGELRFYRAAAEVSANEALGAARRQRAPS